jgi:predicted CXXCH cytochrome family protein
MKGECISMKKLMFALILTCVFLLAVVTTVLADNGPHGSFTATTDACASCHRAHSAQYGNNGLLINNPEALCLTCHDGTNASTNVEDGVYNSGATFPANNNEGATGASLFGGGFVNSLMATAWSGAATANPAFNAVSRPTTSNHTLGASGIVYGSGGINSTQDLMTMECTSCHDPHGNSGYTMTAVPATGTWTVATTPRVATYRLLRFQPQGSGGFTAPATSNWSGGAFPTSGTTSGWTVPDNFANNGTEWYTLGTVARFAAGDYNAGNATNVYNVTAADTGGTARNYIPAAANVAYFCAQCHDRYFANTRLRNGADMSLRCGFDGIAANGVPAGGVFARVGNATANLPVTTTALAANCVEQSTTIGSTPTVVQFYAADGTTPVGGPVTYATGATLWVWGDEAPTGDATHAYMHSSGDVLRASSDGSFVPTAAGMTAPTNVGRTCMACHVSHGTSSVMTALASAANLTTVTAVNDSNLLRMDNRSLCLRCHASTVGFTVAP